MISLANLDLLEERAIRLARKDFWAFRQYMNPRMKRGWWQRQIALEFQAFWHRILNREAPILVLQAPPQHGKSTQVVEFLAWIAGQDQDLKQIYASFSDRLGVRANLQLQRMFESPRYRKVFPGVVIGSGRAGDLTRNRDHIEFGGANGSFRNTTVRGSITGEGLDVGVIDDPIKGRLEANSEANRDAAWDWLTDDFYSRFSEEAAMLMMLTRWHVDDPAGRLIERFDDMGVTKPRVLAYKAIATEDEPFRKAGEPLFPEHKSLEFLRRREGLLTRSSWESLYQQSPFIASGGMFPIDKIGYLDFPPLREQISGSVRYWDKAGTRDGDGAYTAGVLMHQLRDGRTVIADVKRERWEALDRERAIHHCAEADGHSVEVVVEQEPGSGGKESAQATIRNLRGHRVYADRPTGDKATRAEPFAAQVQGGQVLMVRGEWNRPYLQELQEFPNGKHMDQVDASSGAFNRLNGSLYDMEVLAS